jgi:subtilisin family serine protease
LLPIEPGTDPTTVDTPPGIVPVPADDLAVLVAAHHAVGTYAVDNDTLPIAAAGNDGLNLDRTFDNGFSGTIGGVEFDGSAVSVPNEADGFMSVAATGPIGYGWPLDSGETVPTDPRELPTEEPAFFTNYGKDAVDVSAAGGNADLDAIGTGLAWFNDLVLSTTFQVPDENVPSNTQLGNYYRPAYGWKAGTSMAAPQVTGLAALLAAADPNADAADIREQIETTAVQMDVGRIADEDTDDPYNGETTAPAQGVTVTPVLQSGNNVAQDGVFDGDEAQLRHYIPGKVIPLPCSIRQNDQPYLICNPAPKVFSRITGPSSHSKHREFRRSLRPLGSRRRPKHHLRRLRTGVRRRWMALPSLHREGAWPCSRHRRAIGQEPCG